MIAQPAAESDRDRSTERASAGMLVGIDGSCGSLHALRWAAHRTDRFGPVQPILTWNYPWWAYSVPRPPPAEEFRELAERDARVAIDALGSERPLDPIVCRANAGPTLVDVGATSRLIVVGTRGRSGLKDGLLGSVSSYVAAHATVPVAIIPAAAPVEDAHRRIVVGVDDSVNSMTALIWALKHAPSDSAVEVVHAWSYPTGPALGPVGTERYEALVRSTLDDVIRSAADAIGPDPQRIVPRLEYGDPRYVLGERSASADLVVLGARGRSGLPHLLLGSVSTALVHRPVAPIVVVPNIEH